jgi:acetolactate synthase-1/2/3 large subunit
MKYSDLLGDWLVGLGYTHCFFVAGGGIMHLLDGFRSRFACIPVVHEMSAGICVEHFNQCRRAEHRAFALVTTGPGITNIVTAIAGCYVEHRELLVIAGQVKSTDLLTPPQRQRGVQEIDGSAICRPITVRCERLEVPLPQVEFTALVNLSRGPHPGPVVIEVCLDVQGAAVDAATLSADRALAAATELEPDTRTIGAIRDRFARARRPLVLLGGLVTREAAWRAIEMFEALDLPVATTTSAIDRISSRSPVFAGRPGTWGGQRAANLVMAQADVVLALGAQLDLQQTGFNVAEYAPGADLIHVFPSQADLNGAGPPAAMKLCATPDRVLAALLPGLSWEDRDGWAAYVRDLRECVPALEPGNVSRPGYINSFRFFRELSRATDPSDILALCSSGGTFTGALQSYDVASGQMATTSAAHASMGYGLATAIGAAFGSGGRRVILTEGEGGFSQNLQELATVKRHALPIKMFLSENGGYASIRATQKKFFNGAYLGCDPQTGLDFPDWEQLFMSYGIPCRFLNEQEANRADLRRLIDQSEGPEAWIVRVDPEQPNWPAVSTRLAVDGSMSSSPLHDMLPKLPAAILAKVGRYLPGQSGGS